MMRTATSFPEHDMSMAHPTTTGGAKRRLVAAGAERVRRWHVIGTCKLMQRRFGAGFGVTGAGHCGTDGARRKVTCQLSGTARS